MCKNVDCVLSQSCQRLTHHSLLHLPIRFIVINSEWKESIQHYHLNMGRIVSYTLFETVNESSTFRYQVGHVINIVNPQTMIINGMLLHVKDLCTFINLGMSMYNVDSLSDSGWVIGISESDDSMVADILETDLYMPGDSLGKQHICTLGGNCLITVKLEKEVWWRKWWLTSSKQVTVTHMLSVGVCLGGGSFDF